VRALTCLRRHDASLALGPLRVFGECVELRDRSLGYTEYFPAAPAESYPRLECGDALGAEQLEQPQRQISWKCGSHDAQFSHFRPIAKCDLTSLSWNTEISDRYLTGPVAGSQQRCDCRAPLWISSLAPGLDIMDGVFSRVNGAIDVPYRTITQATGHGIVFFSRDVIVRLAK